tara:strand:+ start:1149 stop:2273 length:1125 start_codon:yes stop_codon:yes gene_type:complete
MSRKYNFIDFLVYISIIAFTLRATFFDHGILTYLGIFFGLIIFIYQIIKYPIPINIIFYIILIFFIAYLTFINNGFSIGTIFLPHTISCIGIAWRIYMKGINHNFVLALFYALILNYFLQVLLLDVLQIYSNSRNHISVLFLNLFSLIVISSYINNKAISLLPVLLLLIASITAVGSTGILASLIIFGGYLINKFKNYKFSILVVCAVLLALFMNEIWSYAGLVVGKFYDPNEDMYLKLVKPLPEFFMDNVRFKIIIQYVESLSFYNIIFGTELDTTTILHSLDTNHNLRNLHNSFLMLHSRGGFFSFIYLILVLLKIVQHLKNNFFLGICLISIFVRSLGDTTLFTGGHFEYIFVYLILFQFKRKIPNKSKKL